MNRLTRVRHLARTVVEKILWALAAHRSGIRVLNVAYRRLGWAGRGAIQSRFAGLFRQGQHRLANGSWSVRFAGRELTLPLRANTAWLDWDAALSVLGHEVAIKATYETLLEGPMRPTLFVDIGTNYGTHSLLFLAAGVDVLSFEPNSACHGYFRDVCRLNGVTPRLEHVALGEQPGHVDLYFPERETWLGSLNPTVIERLKTLPDVRTEHVQIRRLDDYAAAFDGRHLLVKIDAEDQEHAVLRGARETLDHHRPLVIFETHRGNSRGALFELFASHQYRIANLPLRPDAPPSLTDRDGFASCPVDDFIAIPEEQLHDWPAGGVQQQRKRRASEALAPR